jgi:hypothetical protein
MDCADRLSSGPEEFARYFVAGTAKWNEVRARQIARDRVGPEYGFDEPVVESIAGRQFDGRLQPTGL